VDRKNEGSGVGMVRGANSGVRLLPVEGGEALGGGGGEEKKR